MAETNSSLPQQIHAFHSLHAAIDSKSLILSQFIDLHEPQLLAFTTERFMERGPRYKEYADLRDRKLRMKSFVHHRTPDKIQNQSAKKQLIFSSTPSKGPNSPSVLRNDNRRPVAALPRSLTPLAKYGSIYGKVGGGGSKSANLTAEKRRGEITKSFVDQSVLTPVKRQLIFNSTPKMPNSVLIQSVRGLPSPLRKENRKPALPPRAERSLTPLAKYRSAFGKIGGEGSKSANLTVEKRSGSAINGGKGGRRGVGRV